MEPIRHERVSFPLPKASLHTKWMYFPGRHIDISGVEDLVDPMFQGEHLRGQVVQHQPIV